MSKKESAPMRETPAQKVARAIIDIGDPTKPRTMYQPPRLSEEQVIALHRQEQARRLK